MPRLSVIWSFSLFVLFLALFCLFQLRDTVITASIHDDAELVVHEVLR